MKFNKLMTVSFVVSAIMGSSAFAADTIEGMINLSGSVPDIFSMRVTQSPGDLDLTPGITIVNRSLGTIHLRYNIDIAEFDATAGFDNGAPADAGAVVYPLWTAASGKMALSCLNGDKTIKGGSSTPVQLGLATVLTKIVDNDADVAPGVAGTFHFLADTTANGGANGVGIETDCSIQFSYATNQVATGTLPMAGVYTSPLTLTLKSK